jgi:aspartate ammonia-lyase
VRLGQEFSAYGISVQKHRAAISAAAESCKELGIGGTATGTGLNSHPKYRTLMVNQLSKQLGIRFAKADDYFEAMQSLRPMVALSGAVRNLAQDLIRIANDIRLLASGPKTGLAELNLPAVQPGSSIMPGKVNPVMAEMLTMVCFQAIGYDTTVLLAAQAGQLELNVMMPVVAYDLLEQIEIVSQAIRSFTKFCLRGITPNEKRAKMYAEASMSIVTALNPHLGYAKAAEIAKESLKSGKSIREILLERHLLTERQIDSIFDLRGMTEPGIRS